MVAASRGGVWIFSLAAGGLLVFNMMAMQPVDDLDAVPEPKPVVAASGNNAGSQALPVSGPKQPALLNGEPGTQIALKVQRELAAKGYQPGQIDGQAGFLTRAAVMAFEYDQRLPLRANVDEDILELLLYGVPDSQRVALGPQSARVGADARKVISQVQGMLAKLGYQVGAKNGQLGIETLEAIRDFEVDQGLPERGRISGQVAARLLVLNGEERMASR